MGKVPGSIPGISIIYFVVAYSYNKESDSELLGIIIERKHLRYHLHYNELLRDLKDYTYIDRLPANSASASALARVR